MGGTWLKPDLGETLSFDPYGYASSDSGHSPFNGNPWAFWDADGRLSANTYNQGTRYVTGADFIPGWDSYQNTAIYRFLKGLPPRDDYQTQQPAGFWENVAIGATAGDFATEDTGWGGVVGQTGAGFIPIYGQIGDVRDTAAALNNLTSDGGWRSGGNWVGVGAAVVAWVPGFDWVKGGRKVVSRLDDVPPGGLTPPHGGGGPPSGSTPPSAPSAPPTGTGPYAEVEGHHVHAKKGFEGAPGYDLREAFSVSEDTLSQYGVRHADITAAQQRLFREFAGSGAPNTITHHSRIAYQALVEAGMPAKVAKDLVLQSQTRLIRSGVVEPTRVPWGGR
jgi:hypothetical protein